MHGTKVSNLGVSRADLVIVIGARFSDRVIGNASKFAPNAKIVHIDIDAAEIDKNIPANASIVGDAKGNSCPVKQQASNAVEPDMDG